jgi:hypothetical protein
MRPREYCTEDTARFYLLQPFDESFCRTVDFRMRAALAIGTGIRMAVAVAAIYAMLFNALLSAAAPLLPALSADAVICVHEGAGSDQPAPPLAAHDSLCCVAVCGAVVAALPPTDYSQIVLSLKSIFVRAKSSITLVAPAPVANFQASPRGPPSLV